MQHTLKVLSVMPVTHNVHRIRFGKPEGYKFTPGQATDVSVNKPDWADEKRPFTFTCLNDDPYLEFTIKSYNDHDGVTKQIGLLAEGDSLIIDDPWGAIEYKGEGYFIAGGAGITPFMAILRQLHKDGLINGNKLFFSNKTEADIIYKEELTAMLGDQVYFVITSEKHAQYLNGHIDEAFIEQYMPDMASKHVYVCGPDPMVKGLTDIAIAKGADPDTVVFEK